MASGIRKLLETDIQLLSLHLRGRNETPILYEVVVVRGNPRHTKNQLVSFRRLTSIYQYLTQSYTQTTRQDKANPWSAKNVSGE